MVRGYDGLHERVKRRARGRASGGSTAGLASAARGLGGLPRPLGHVERGELLHVGGMDADGAVEVGLELCELFIKARVGGRGGERRRVGQARGGEQERQLKHGGRVCVDKIVAVVFGM